MSGTAFWVELSDDANPDQRVRDDLQRETKALGAESVAAELLRTFSGRSGGSFSFKLQTLGRDNLSSTRLALTEQRKVER